MFHVQVKRPSLNRNGGLRHHPTEEDVQTSRETVRPYKNKKSVSESMTLDNPT